jgi:hypothetical protein
MLKKKLTSEFKVRKNAKELPATQGMLQLVRSELKSDIRGLRSEMKSGFNQIDSKLEQVQSSIDRLSYIVEEQNSRNQVVLEGLTGLFQRQNQIELRNSEVENLVQGLAARSRR